MAHLAPIGTTSYAYFLNTSLSTVDNPTEYEPDPTFRS